MTDSLELLRHRMSDTPPTMSASFFAGYLCMVDSIVRGEDEYKVEWLPGQLNTVMGRALNELNLSRQRVGITRLNKIQTYLTGVVDSFGRDFAVRGMGLEPAHVLRIGNPFNDQSIVRGVLDIREDKRHTIRPEVLAPYIPTAETSL